MKKLIVCISLAFCAATLCWGQSHLSGVWDSQETLVEDIVRKVARYASRSIYMETNSAYQLNVALKNTRKGVKLHVIMHISAAEKSNDLGKLLKRGDELWVHTTFYNPTVIVADGELIGSAKTMWVLYDEKKASDFIDNWKFVRSRTDTVPVK